MHSILIDLYNVKGLKHLNSAKQLVNKSKENNIHNDHLFCLELSQSAKSSNLVMNCLH